MENIEQNKPDDNILELKRARAWIITLALGIAVCLVAIAYTFTTHNSAISFLDSSLFKPGLVWLGFIGLILCFVSYLLFWIGSSVIRFLPDKKPLDNITIVIGILSLLLSFILLFISYDIENNWLYYLGWTGQMTGVSMILLQEVIQKKFNKAAKIWKLIGITLTFTGLVLIGYSFDT